MCAAKRRSAQVPIRPFVWRHSRSNGCPGRWEQRHAITPEPVRGSALSADDFRLLREAVETRRCRGLVGVGSFDEAADRWRPSPPCPACGSPGTIRRGRTSAGRRFRECRACGRKFASLTGTIFESSKKALWRWVLFIRLMCFNVQLDACAELCGVSHQTAWERGHRAMATIDGYQDRSVLRDKVRIDETCVTDPDLRGEPGWRPRRGLGRNKICIAVAIDVHKNVVAVRCGHGKPSARRIKDALLSHIAEGPGVFPMSST